MSFDVWTTAVASRQLQALRNVTRANAKRAMDDLERRGCEAAHYRLEGGEVERFCVLPLGGNWRMIVAFPASTEVAIVLVGQHLENSSPELTLLVSVGHLRLQTVEGRDAHRLPRVLR